MAKGPDGTQGADDKQPHDANDDNGIDNPSTHDLMDDKGVDDPATHDVGDDHGFDDPATHDAGDDQGIDDPATHDVGDDHRLDDPATHDVGDDKAGTEALRLFVNQRTGQIVFSSDDAECAHWADDSGKHALDLTVSLPTRPDDNTIAVWRFHDPKSDVYFWTADDMVKESILRDLPAIEFEGEAFRAYRDDASGGHAAIGLVWDREAGGDFGNFVYAPVDDAIALAGQSTTDGIDYLGVAFWI